MKMMLPDLVGLPETSVVVFENPPLVLAVCEVRFASILGIADPVFVAPFQRAIMAQYPKLSRVAGIEMEVDVGGSEPEIRNRGASSSWRFSDPDDNWVVVLSQGSVALETRTYERFYDFLARLRQVLDVLNQHIQPAVRSRIGLRYINEVRPGHSDWRRVIRQDLLGPLVVPELWENAKEVTSVQQLVIRYGGNQGLNIRHGLIPGGTAIQPRPGEEPPQEPFYVLDFDAFQEVQPATSLSMNIDEICRYVEKFNQVIYRLFRWAITQDYVSTLGVREHATD